jgi:phosphoglycolate phosphatase
MAYQLILWDFDGTLADTLASLVELYNELAAKYGFRPVTNPELVRGLTPLAFLREYRIPLRRVPTLARQMRAAQREHMPSTRLFADLVPVLEAIHAAGPPMGILSSNASENIWACLRANRTEGLFEFVIGYSRLLGKAQAIRHLLRARKLHPSELVYVGDEVRDLEAARQAGVVFAAVTWGLNTHTLLATQDPDYLFEQPNALLRLLE